MSERQYLITKEGIEKLMISSGQTALQAGFVPPLGSMPDWAIDGMIELGLITLINEEGNTK